MGGSARGQAGSNGKSSAANRAGRPSHGGVYSQPMAARLIDGAAQAEREKAGVRRRAAQLAESGRRPALVAVLIGSTPAGELYASRQAQACENVGINYRLHKLDAGMTQAAV